MATRKNQSGKEPISSRVYGDDDDDSDTSDTEDSSKRKVRARHLTMSRRKKKEEKEKKKRMRMTQVTMGGVPLQTRSSQPINVPEYSEDDLEEGDEDEEDEFDEDDVQDSVRMGAHHRDTPVYNLSSYPPPRYSSCPRPGPRGLPSPPTPIPSPKSGEWRSPIIVPLSRIRVYPVVSLVPRPLVHLPYIDPVPPRGGPVSARVSTRPPPLIDPVGPSQGPGSTGVSPRPVTTTASSGDSSQSRVSDDIDPTTWLVTDEVPGGPIDGSVIPSFLGHIAYHFWHGYNRPTLNIFKGEKILNKLKMWYKDMDDDVDGELVTGTSDTDLLRGHAAGILGMDMNDYKWSHGGVSDSFILERCEKADANTQASAFLWVLLASTLFMGKSGGRPRVYDWIPPSFAGPTSVSDRLRQVRERLDRFTELEVKWEPFGPGQQGIVPRTIYSGWIMYRNMQEPYMPDRCIRQIGYVQSIPRSLMSPADAFRGPRTTQYFVQHSAVDTLSTWRRFPESACLNLTRWRYNYSGDIVGECEDGYLEWYRQYSHPFLLPITDPSAVSTPAKSRQDY
ncbi:OLC1v1016220C1 [Oldenlandia corymbosa var. corymbosa]|uniref:OLC1v1016220C1 n=1 Tax=Oldenlandia corymbosa var. corymbosa TaxID=529605 RepID=A0AAV1E5X5_OLDCO|nr:OLC1v1016220C1 [Oldenlandia corymbosa var. corymbosa]